MTANDMRHNDMRLTNTTYTDASQLPIAEAVKKLPTFGTVKTNAPGNARPMNDWSCQICNQHRPMSHHSRN